MPDPDDMILVRRDDLRAAVGYESPVKVNENGPDAWYARLLAAVNGEAATVEYDMFDGMCHGRFVGPWTTQHTTDGSGIDGGTGLDLDPDLMEGRRLADDLPGSY